MEAEVATAERWAPAWWAVFLIGIGMWAAAFGVARLTHNVILLPTIVLLGSFLVPVTAVVWYLDHDPSPALSRGESSRPSSSLVYLASLVPRSSSTGS